MQPQHRSFILVFSNQRPHLQRAGDSIINKRLLFEPRRMQHVIDDFLLRSRITRVPDTEPQTPKVLAADGFGNIVESIVTASAAAELQACDARREIELIM